MSFTKRFIVLSAFLFALPIFALLAVPTVAQAENIFNENFDGLVPPALPAGWGTSPVYFPSGAEPKWQTHAGTVHPPGVAALTSPNLLYFNCYSVLNPKSARLRTKDVDLSIVDAATLIFWMYHDTDASFTSYYDYIKVQVSTDNGSNWDNASAAFPRYTFKNEWQRHTVDLGDYTGPGNTDVRVALLGVSGFGNDMHLDNITLSIIPTPTTTTVPVCTDNDSDGYGANCDAGPDCDDNDSSVFENCSECSVRIIPRALGLLLGEREKTRSLLVIGSAGAEFDADTEIAWDTEGIETLNKWVSFKRFMFLKVRLDGALLDKQTYELSVGGCKGSIRMVR